jgi:hypothetical protein
MNVGPSPDHPTSVTSEFQTSDRLRDILQRAKARSAGTLAAAPDQRQPEASVEALLDRNQPLPDPRALSRLYQQQALAVRLPESLEAEAEVASAQQPYAPGFSDLPAPVPRPEAAEGGPQPPVWADEEPHPSQPAMSPSEIRSVMQKLQSEFGGTYAVFETPQAPPEDFVTPGLQEDRDRELAELKRLAEESAASSWIFMVGSVIVVVILATFIYLAAAGPLRAAPTPVATPAATAPAHHP